MWVFTYCHCKTSSLVVRLQLLNEDTDVTDLEGIDKLCVQALDQVRIRTISGQRCRHHGRDQVKPTEEK